jgi:regulation of enolase protein 1 (concanavalin A-like superfamily)
MLALTPGSGAAFLHRAVAGGVTFHSGAAGKSPLHVRLVRSGDVFTGYVSADGKAWIPVDTATIPMASSVRVGMAVTSNQAGIAAEGSFSRVEVLQSSPASISGRVATPSSAARATFRNAQPWSKADAKLRGRLSGGSRQIFMTLAPGNVSSLQGRATAGGERYRFHSVALPADGEIVARVVSIRNSDPWAKAGVMIRESLAPGARHAFMALMAGHGGTFQRRVAEGGPSLETSAGAAEAPYWVRLVRSGGVFRGYRSADGMAWTLVGQERIAHDGEMRAGLAVASHGNASLFAAVFDNVSVRLASVRDRGGSGESVAEGAADGFRRSYHGIDDASAEAFRDVEGAE